jgi:hypothetical protein
MSRLGKLVQQLETLRAHIYITPNLGSLSIYWYSQRIGLGILTSRNHKHIHDSVLRRATEIEIHTNANSRYNLVQSSDSPTAEQHTQNLHHSTFLGNWRALRTLNLYSALQ